MKDQTVVIQKGRPNIPLVMQQKIKVLYTNGYKYREIRDALNVSLGTIHKYLSEK